MFFRKQPNRAVYGTTAWRSMNPLDRASMLLVAEGLKPSAHCGASISENIRAFLQKELGIYFTGERMKTAWDTGTIGVFTPNKVYTVCANDRILRKWIRVPPTGTARRWWKIEGTLLGYPHCCIKEYSEPTFEQQFNQWAIAQIPKGKRYRFELESLQRLVDGDNPVEQFLYLTPGYAPCSVNCGPTKRLLRKWKLALNTFDPEAAAETEAINRSIFAQWKKVAEQLRKKGVTATQFDIGHIFH